MAARCCRCRCRCRCCRCRCNNWAAQRARRRWRGRRGSTAHAPRPPALTTAGPPRRWDSWGRLLQPALARLPMMGLPGNHEIEDFLPPGQVGGWAAGACVRACARALPGRAASRAAGRTAGLAAAALACRAPLHRGQAAPPRRPAAPAHPPAPGPQVSAHQQRGLASTRLDVDGPFLAYQARFSFNDRGGNGSSGLAPLWYSFEVARAHVAMVSTYSPWDEASEQVGGGVRGVPSAHPRHHLRMHVSRLLAWCGRGAGGRGCGVARGCSSPVAAGGGGWGVRLAPGSTSRRAGCCHLPRRPCHLPCLLSILPCHPPLRLPSVRVAAAGPGLG
jgi:hypothetical protein